MQIWIAHRERIGHVRAASQHRGERTVVGTHADAFSLLPFRSARGSLQRGAGRAGEGGGGGREGGREEGRDGRRVRPRRMIN
jgi:hypothetical protein